MNRQIDRKKERDIHTVIRLRKRKKENTRKDKNKERKR